MTSQYCKQTPNLFAQLGYDEVEIEKRLDAIYEAIFYGSEEERLVHAYGEDMAYIVDTGNNDVRTEGMSYAMMMCVQRDMQKEFDALWKWVKTYMWMTEGRNKGYFAWSVSITGEKKSDGPAPDGEEYFAMALFFASNRWGDKEGIFEYSKEARAILHECIHKGENEPGYSMWNRENKLIRFVPSVEFSDPSYHLPHFYELFALWVDEEDRTFWKAAASASRAYLMKACHSKTGLAPEYAHYDGTPRIGEGHERYYSDAYRVIANIGLDYAWFGETQEESERAWETQCVQNIQAFFCETVEGKADKVYYIDGTIIDEPALHPVAIIATNAMGSLATTGKYSEECIKKFWRTPLRKGDRRYYDNCLYLFAFLALSGNYRIWD